MPATRRKVIVALERSSSESSLYTASGTSSSLATDSDASSSYSPAPTSAALIKQRRTRKRISQSQLNALEALFVQSTHPTQQEREALSKAIHMEVKNVTIWFQNRRQAARKVALHEAITQSNSLSASHDVPASLVEAPLRRVGTPVTPEQIATPPANEDQFSTFAPSPAPGESSWHPRGSPQLNHNARRAGDTNEIKSDPDEDMIAAAVALAQMRAV